MWQRKAKCLFTSKTPVSVQAHTQKTQLYPHNNPTSVPRRWCHRSFPAVIKEQHEWQRSSSSDGSLIKSASSTYYCVALLPWRQKQEAAELYLCVAPRSRPLEPHANQCQSTAVWIVGAVCHNRWTALPGGRAFNMEPAGRDRSCDIFMKPSTCAKQFVFFSLHMHTLLFCYQ